MPRFRTSFVKLAPKMPPAVAAPSLGGERERVQWAGGGPDVSLGKMNVDHRLVGRHGRRAADRTKGLTECRLAGSPTTGYTLTHTRVTSAPLPRSPALYECAVKNP
jgi:hypothetical protein